MKQIVGTCVFSTRTAADKYYAKQGFSSADVQRKIDEGEIYIGKENVIGTIVQQVEGRYFVELLAS